MTLEIEIRINGVHIAYAEAGNIGTCTGRAELSDYVVEARTEPSPVTGSPVISHNKVVIYHHKREQSVWALVAKVATALAQRENGADPRRAGLTAEMPDELRTIALDALGRPDDDE